MIRNLRARTAGTLRNHTRTLALALVTLALVGAFAGSVSGGAVAATEPQSGPQAGQWQASNSSVPLIVTDSIVVSGESAAPGQAGCQVLNRFYHGQRVVFRLKIIDPQTGDQVTNKSVDGVTVNVPMGDGSTKKLDAHFGKHPGGDHFWTVGWTVPDSYPAGQVDYTVTVTNQQAEKINFAVPPSELTVLNGTLKDAKAAANQSSGDQGGNGAPSSAGGQSLPVVFWALVGIVAVVVVGLVWNAERQ